MQTRRQFLHSVAACASAAGPASGVIGLIPRRAQAKVTSPAILGAREVSLQLAPSGYAETGVWGYDGSVPGPEIRVAQGGRVSRRLVNDLPQETSIHWHGIRIDNAMDGVANLTQEPVAPSDSFDYGFAVPDAGTYWYHSHNRSWEQVARGLHGALIIEESAPPDVNRDEVLILDDWLLNPETAQIDDSFDDPMMMSHAGRIGNYITTNARYDLSLPVRRNERLRLRLINASNARIFLLQLVGLSGWTVALDGMPLPVPEPINGMLVLGPAQRVDLIVDVTAKDGQPAHLLRIGNDERPVSQVAFPVRGTASRAPRSTPAPLPPNPGMAAPDLSAARRLRLVMAGGAMGRMDSAILGGERQGFRHLATAGRFWAFNEMAEMTRKPFADLSLGEPVRLEIVNDTVFPHAMHLHGMHFREVRADGAVSQMRDTLMIAAGETREIAFVADNPGDWLFHCHMLSHAASGMMTWVRIT